jgi:hypothetical protein
MKIILPSNISSKAAPKFELLEKLSLVVTKYGDFSIAITLCNLFFKSFVTAKLSGIGMIFPSMQAQNVSIKV